MPAPRARGKQSIRAEVTVGLDGFDSPRDTMNPMIRKTDRKTLNKIANESLCYTSLSETGNVLTDARRMLLDENFTY